MSAQERELDVAVVIVSYRSAPLVADCLQSLALQRHDRLRLHAVVVDNASGDFPQLQHTVAEQGWTEWVTLVLAPRNGGFAYGCNLGIQQASAQRWPAYVYLLNPDTRVREGAVAALVQFLEAHAEVGIAGSSLESADGSEWPFAFRFPGLLSEIDAGLEFGLLTRLLRPWVVVRRMEHRDAPVDWVSGAAFMVRREVFAAIGGLDENYFLYFEETDFCRRARHAGFLTWYVPESRVMHIGGASTEAGADVARGPLAVHWFESRRRYFATTYGISRAMLIDAVAIVAFSLGRVKRLLLGRKARAHFIRDLVQYSVLWPQNRVVTLPRTQLPCLRREAG